MKLAAIILSLFTLILSASPCDDEGIYGAGQSTSISQGSDHTSNNGFDLCSPFCSCVCCTGVVLESNIQQRILILETPVKELNTTYVVSFSNNYLSLIYQPPQV